MHDADPAAAGGLILLSLMKKISIRRLCFFNTVPESGRVAVLRDSKEV